MTNPQPCDTHDMRPMPSMRANVCRRCGYYVPIEEDDAWAGPGWWICPSIVGGLLAFGCAFAFFLT